MRVAVSVKDFLMQADDGRRVFNALLDSDEEEGDSGMRGDDAANKSVRFAPLPLVNDQAGMVLTALKWCSYGPMSMPCLPSSAPAAVLPTTPIGSARPKPADKTEEEPSGILRATAL